MSLTLSHSLVVWMSRMPVPRLTTSRPRRLRTFASQPPPMPAAVMVRPVRAAAATTSRVKARPTASLSKTRPRRARTRERSRCFAPRRPTSSQMVNTTSSGGWRRARSRHTRTHSQTRATPDLSSPPRTVVPSVRMTSSSTIGLTPSPGATVSMCAQRRSAGASVVPGRCAIRLPVSPPSAAPASSKLTSAPRASSSRASRAAIRPSRREWLSIRTSSRKSDFRRAGSITSGGHYHGDPLVARRAGTYRHARGGCGRDPDRGRGSARHLRQRAGRAGACAGHRVRGPGADREPGPHRRAAPGRRRALGRGAVRGGHPGQADRRAHGRAVGQGALQRGAESAGRAPRRAVRRPPRRSRHAHDHGRGHRGGLRGGARRGRGARLARRVRVPRRLLRPSRPVDRRPSFLDARGHRARAADRDRRYHRAGRRPRRRARRADAGERDARPPDPGPHARRAPTRGQAMERLRLARAALDDMLAHARATHPEECCGAVLELGGRDVVRRFTNVQARLHREDPAAHPRNAETAYTPEPKELFAALREGEAPGARVKVFYHSHTRVGAYFSGEDRARAMFGDEPAYPEVTYVVVSDSRTPGEARAFRWDEGARDFVEVPIEVC